MYLQVGPERFLDCSHMSGVQAAHLANKKKIHVLVDLVGYTGVREWVFIRCIYYIYIYYMYVHTHTYARASARAHTHTCVAASG
jgi:hypothetical protein